MAVMNGTFHPRALDFVTNPLERFIIVKIFRGVVGNFESAKFKNQVASYPALANLK
jgi:hypothetical protein